MTTARHRRWRKLTFAFAAAENVASLALRLLDRAETYSASALEVVGPHTTREAVRHGSGPHT